VLVSILDTLGSLAVVGCNFGNWNDCYDDSPFGLEDTLGMLAWNHFGDMNGHEEKINPPNFDSSTPAGHMTLSSPSFSRKDQTSSCQTRPPKPYHPSCSYTSCSRISKRRVLR